METEIRRPVYYKRCLKNLSELYRFRSRRAHIYVRAYIYTLSTNFVLIITAFRNLFFSRCTVWLARARQEVCMKATMRPAAARVACRWPGTRTRPNHHRLSRQRRRPTHLRVTLPQSAARTWLSGTSVSNRRSGLSTVPYRRRRRISDTSIRRSCTIKRPPTNRNIKGLFSGETRKPEFFVCAFTRKIVPCAWH